MNELVKCFKDFLDVDTSLKVTPREIEDLMFYHSNDLKKSQITKVPYEGISHIELYSK